VSRGFDDDSHGGERLERERTVMQSRWGDLLVSDPAYSPNLGFGDQGFGLADPVRVPAVSDMHIS
ncbi:uncharacterized protein METZ01_LOCUS506723, partial [marine metagenome]